MGWMQKLCEAYDAGIICDQSRESVRLVPLGFICKKIKYHVILTLEGKFVSADELAGERQFQEIPSTPQAEGRSGNKVAPFPLSEQLKYLVFEDSNLYRFRKYMEQLKEWCSQPDAPVCLKAVYTYLDGHTLLEDLEAQPGLKLNYNRGARKRKEAGDDAGEMVCFSVQMQDGSNDDLWMRADVRKSWSRYLADKLPGNKGFCYVEGKMLPIMETHPKVKGNAKLISAKDTAFPFQYRGRFEDARSAALVSYDASVRAHNALIWLIARQGMRKYGETWVVWNTNGTFMKVPIDEEDAFFEEEEDEEDTDSGPVADTFKAYAEVVKQAALGRCRDLKGYDQERTNCAVIMGLEAVTDGRMSVTYYQECYGNEYVKRLENWYLDCCWWHCGKDGKAKKLATPDPDEIAVAVLGMDAVNIAKRDKKHKELQTRLMRRLNSDILISIAERRSLPESMVSNAFTRACTPLTFVSRKRRQWSRNRWEASVNTSCAMIYCFQKRRVGGETETFAPELEETSRNPDYLYGRLLALADRIEEKAMNRGADCPTNAVRLMQKFVRDPFGTWPEVHDKLIPVFCELGSESTLFQIMAEEIEQAFSGEDRCRRKALSWEFLQGFSSQRQYFWQKDKEIVKHRSEEEAVFELPWRRSELYGCLLAVADTVEKKASGGERAGRTNAVRMMPSFTAKPYENWGQLHSKLIPYLEKLGGKSGYYQQLIGKIEMQFSQTERESTAPLDGSYLHGYYCMLKTFYQKTRFSAQPLVWENAADSRSALFGRMLGIAERLERRYLAKTEEGAWRISNELRFMTAFARSPVSIWEMLKVKLVPYQRHTWSSTEKDVVEWKQIEEELRLNGWYDNTPLGSVYLYYYYKERRKENE